MIGGVHCFGAVVGSVSIGLVHELWGSCGEYVNVGQLWGV